MRFVSFPSGQAGKPVLVNADKFDLAAYTPLGSEEAPAIFKVCYGKFTPQLGAPPLTRAKHLLRCQGASFVGFTREGERQLAEVRGIHLFRMCSSLSGKRVWFPCFVLLRTTLNLPPRKSRGPLFLYPCQTDEARERNTLRYVEPLGFLGLKAEVLKARPLLAENPNMSDWMRFASEDAAERIARSIY